ncbi:cysteine--tRNA ligase [Marinicella sp. W31]|uniref:cysteine--tRNA ligase n=1 Tax=Marinicella sp. W31 TaxID=3023713 RepID=UPI0037577F9D
MTLRLHNSLSGRKEDFVPIDDQRVTMYLCGPTVYNYAHIGNARPAVVFDVLNRLLRHLYPHVVFARNITDIDDKINNRALQEGVPIQDISSQYAQAYNEDLKGLGVLPPDIEPYATEHIDEMIEMIKTLVDQGHAYAADGHVLFDVTSYAQYGQLSKCQVEEMLAGARVEVADYKKHPGDFVLWKPSDETLPGWNSPWGRGRPGWHIECSAMARKHLGTVIDIHCGGKDLMFPHHENEVAQSCCANETDRFANYWVHNGFITMSEQKMSKSLGNIELIREVLAENQGETIRWLLLSAHYRQSIDYSDAALEQSKRTLDRIYATLRDHADIDISHQANTIDTEVLAALKDDLNTPKVFARINELAKDLAKADSLESRQQLKSALIHSAAILGVLQHEPKHWFELHTDTTDLDVSRIEQMITERNAARDSKDWAESDRIRDELSAMGIVLEDGADGTRWSRS